MHVTPTRTTWGFVDLCGEDVDLQGAKTNTCVPAGAARAPSYARPMASSYRPPARRITAWLRHTAAKGLAGQTGGGSNVWASQAQVPEYRQRQQRQHRKQSITRRVDASADGDGGPVDIRRPVPGSLAAAPCRFRPAQSGPVRSRAERLPAEMGIVLCSSVPTNISPRTVKVVQPRAPPSRLPGMFSSPAAAVARAPWFPGATQSGTFPAYLFYGGLQLGNSTNFGQVNT